MRPIKFRGTDILTGNTAFGYGFLYAMGDYGYLVNSNSELIPVLVDSDSKFIPVNEKTVAQLVGYDKNGKEIYSDDKIRVYDHSRYCLAGTGIEDAEDFIKVADIGKTFDNVELYEESEKNDK